MNPPLGFLAIVFLRVLPIVARPFDITLRWNGPGVPDVGGALTHPWRVPRQSELAGDRRFCRLHTLSAGERRRMRTPARGPHEPFPRTTWSSACSWAGASVPLGSGGPT